MLDEEPTRAIKTQERQLLVDVWTSTCFEAIASLVLIVGVSYRHWVEMRSSEKVPTGNYVCKHRAIAPLRGI
ncbi:hypothetical protein M758_6G120100 [Ceratodon purpureus]|nr:hypothetical protein M758_6G120100 [Ceratodon purpureus]